MPNAQRVQHRNIILERGAQSATWLAVSPSARLVHILTCCARASLMVAKEIYCPINSSVDRDKLRTAARWSGDGRGGEVARRGVRHSPDAVLPSPAVADTI